MARRKTPRKPREPTAPSGRPTSSASGSSPEGTGAGGQPQGGAPQHPGGTGGVSTGHGYGGHGAPPSASSTAATASSAAGYPSAAPAGPSVSESSTYRRAARQQARLIQQYAINNEQDRLEQKHYEFDNQGRITKQKATNEEIHHDLQKARDNVKTTTKLLFSSPRVQRANIKGKVLGPKKIKRIEAKRTAKVHEAQQAQHAPARHARQRDRLHHLTDTTIPKLERRRDRLSQAQPLGISLTGPTEGDRARRLAEVENKLGLAHAEADRLGGLITQRRGRRAPQITPTETALALSGLIPPVRLGTGAAEIALAARAAEEAGGVAAGAAAKAAAARLLPKAVMPANKALSTRLIEGSLQRLAPKSAGRVAAGIGKAPKPIGGVLGYAERHPFIAGGAAYGAANPDQGAEALRRLAIGAAGQAKGFWENPHKVLERTGQAAYGMLVAGVGDAANVGVTAGRAALNLGSQFFPTSKTLSGEDAPMPYTWEEVVAPTVGSFNAFLDANKQLGETILSGDIEKASEATKGDFGLAPSIMAALALKPVGGGAVTEGAVRGARTAAERTRGYLSDLPEGSSLGKFAKRKNLGRRRPEIPGEPQHVFSVFERRSQRIEESHRAAVTAEHQRGELGYVSDKIEKATRRKDFKKGMEDYIAVVSEKGLNLNNLSAARRTVQDLKASVPKDSRNYKDFTRLEEALPTLAKSKGFREAVDAYRDWDQFWREAHRGGKADERSIYQPIATLEDIRFPEERKPPQIADILRTEPKAGQNMRTAIRDEARVDFKKAKSLLVKARVEKAKGNTEAAVELRAQAQRVKDEGLRKRDAVTVQRVQSDEATLAEYVGESKAAIARRNLRDPSWLSHRPASGKDVGELNVQQTYQGGHIPPKEKMRHAKLLASGNVDYSYASLITESIFNRVNPHFLRQHVSEVLGETRIGVEKDGVTESLLTGPEWRRAEQEGQVSAKHTTLISLQEVNRVLEKGTTDELATLFGQSMWSEVRAAEGTEGKKYFAIPKETGTEMMAQMKGAGNKALVNLQRATSRLLLGTSPAWAISQVFAESFQATAAVNAYRLTRGYDAFKHMSPREQRSFAAQMEAAEGGGLMPEARITLRHSSADDMSGALSAYDRTHAGKWLKELATANPLIAADRWKANQLRVAVAAGEVDRALNSYLTGLGSLSKVHREVIADLKGKPLEEQLVYISEHPEVAKKVASYTRDVMGSWSAMTRYERRFGPITMFYPFLRMSLRWTFRSFPARHPIKAAILWDLATANAIEVRSLLGGDPSFVQTFGDVPLYTGPGGTPKQLLPLGRIAPGGNALIEAGISPDTTDLSAFARIINPVVATGLLIGLNRDPVTGRELTDKEKKAQDSIPEKAKLWGAQLLSLPTAARALDAAIRHEPRAHDAVPIIGPRNPSPYAQLFRNIQGTGQVLRAYGLPFLPIDTERQIISERVSRLLTTAVQSPKKADLFAASKDRLPTLAKKYEEGKQAWATLDDYLVAWGVETEEQQKRQAKNFGKKGDRVYELLDELEGAKDAGKAVKTLSEGGGYGAIDFGKKTGGYGSIHIGGSSKKGGYGYSPAAPLSARDKRIDKTLAKLIATPDETLAPLNASEKKLWKGVSNQERTAAVNRAQKKGLYDQAIVDQKVAEKGPAWEIGQAVKPLVQLLNAPKKYERLWEKTGFKGPMPELELNAPPVHDKTKGKTFKAAGYADEQGVHLSPKTSRQLGKGLPWAKATLLHEFAHTQQPTSLQPSGLREGLADIYANREAKRLGISTSALLRSPEYKAYRKEARAETTPRYQMKGQFREDTPLGDAADTAGGAFGKVKQNRRAAPGPPLPRKVQAAIDKASKAIDRVLDIAAPTVNNRAALKKAKPGIYQTPAGDVVHKFEDGHVAVVDHVEEREDPKIQGPQEKRLAKNLLKAAANRVQIDADLTPEQMEFAKAFSKSAGVSPQFAAAAVLYEGGNNTPGDQNWLNIGWTGSGRADITYNPVWQGDPAQAGKLTGQWLNGQWGQQDGYVAAPAIQAITSNKGDVAQGEAWATSGWAESGAGPLNTIDQVSASTTPLPKGLKRRAQQELGKKATQEILSGGGETTATPEQVPGAWAGSQHAVLSMLPKTIRAEGRNDKRTPEENSSVGGATDSDHLTTNTKAYAADIPVDPEVYATLRKELGLPPAETGEDSVTKDGYRYQLIYGSQYGHGDHIHLGAEWVGAGIPEGTTAGGPVTTGVPSSGGTSYAPSAGGVTTTSGGTGIPSLAKTPKPRFSQSKLLKAIGEDQGFNQLFGGAAPPPAAEDATMAAMAEIAATRKRLLKR